ncbi:MAG: hypothetical protein L0Y72_32110 [Gemmataceae bacterium]|nr:hypothetical protein [Gemmataceae bacterium]MCI0743700.1 hypothetical protein [Gemmataceae bacterium]
MQRTLRALLGNIVDYAGMFPPASLPLDEAWRNYLHYRKSPQAWLLGRFICPAARLSELDVRELTEPAALCVLGRGGDSPNEYFAAVKADLADIARLREQHGEQIAADTYEVRLPASPFAPAKSNQIASLIATTAFLIETTGPPQLTPFFEAPHAERQTFLSLIQALHDERASREAAARTRCRPPGFKLRTGGTEASAFPSTALVGLALAACRAAHVPLKSTAGLHHPMRHFDATLGVHMHGFVNLFAAGCFLWKHTLEETELSALLEEEEYKHFRFEEDGLHWRERHVTPDDVAAARRGLVLSFGSCSFLEPCEDLRTLGWLAH